MEIVSLHETSDIPFQQAAQPIAFFSNWIELFAPASSHLVSRPRLSTFTTSDKNLDFNLIVLRGSFTR